MWYQKPQNIKSVIFAFCNFKDIESDIFGFWPDMQGYL